LTTNILPNESGNEQLIIQLQLTISTTKNTVLKQRCLRLLLYWKCGFVLLRFQCNENLHNFKLRNSWRMCVFISCVIECRPRIDKDSAAVSSRKDGSWWWVV